MTIDKTWKAMNDLDEAFSRITTLDFLAEQLQGAIDSQNELEIVDACLAMNAFIPVYTKNWDHKFKTAWDQIITSPTQNDDE